jgi:hypothetical protein
VDVELEFGGPDRTAGGPDRVIVESKSTGVGSADRALAGGGVRPVSLSKYCVGIALTRPGATANRWNRILRREFGWSRLDEPPSSRSGAAESACRSLPRRSGPGQCLARPVLSSPVAQHWPFGRRTSSVQTERWSLDAESSTRVLPGRAAKWLS